MTTEIEKKQPWFKRGLQNVGRTAFNIILPPIAGKYHRRYTNRVSLLYFDTILILLIMFLVGLFVIVKVNDKTMVGPELSAELVFNKPIENGEETRLTIRLGNTGNTNIERIYINFDTPEGYTYISAQYGAVNSNNEANSKIDLENGSLNQWILSGLAVGEEKDFVLTGRFIGRDGDLRNIKFLITGEAGMVKLARTIKEQSTIRGRLLVTTTIDGEAEVVSGDRINITAGVKNTMAIDLTASELVISLPRGFVPTSYVPLPDRSSNIWKVPTVPPGSSWEVRITGKYETSQPAEIEFLSQIYVTQGSQRYFQNETSRSLIVKSRPKAEEIINPPGSVVNKLQFAAEAHYFSSTGVQFGYGPIPPKVGQITGYRIFWVLRNNNQSYQNIIIESIIPSDTEWAGNGSVSLGQPISYNSTNRKAVWQIGEVSSSQQYLTGSFEVTVQPKWIDIGKMLTLINESRVVEYIGVSKKTIATYPSLSTAVNEAQAAGKGIVIK